MDTALRAHLITMADLLDHNPEQPASLTLTATGRRDLARHVTGGREQTLLGFIPPIIQPITRGAYATRLRTIAGVG